MKILITGITGTLGQKVTEILRKEMPQAIIYGISRDEQKLRLISQDENLQVRICDIKDAHALNQVAEEMEYFNKIFHFASLKCVDTLETCPIEAVKTNILGTQNILDLSKKVMAEKVVFTSTDKAVYPINAYGQTKALAEKLVLSSSHANVVTRYGNILGSRGSFLPSLVKTLKERKLAYITHKDMTRFWMTIEDAARFVISCGFSDRAGLCLPPKLRSSTILSLISVVAEVLDIKPFEIKLIGIRDGEKIHEYLRTSDEVESDGESLCSCDCLMSREDLKALVESVI
jgi:UDP-N-acetylglucosamine 4,6-dehydratase